MTAPVTMYKEMSELAGVKKIEMCYYIPSKHQADPPKPIVKDVYIKKRGSMKVAVRLVGVITDHYKFLLMLLR